MDFHIRGMVLILPIKDRAGMIFLLHFPHIDPSMNHVEGDATDTRAPLGQQNQPTGGNELQQPVVKPSNLQWAFKKLTTGFRFTHIFQVLHKLELKDQ